MPINNLDKVLSYIVHVCKTPKIIVDDREYVSNRQRIQLSSTFFRKDGCEMCGRCCALVTHSLVLSQSEYDKAMKYTRKEFEDYGLNPDDLDSLQQLMEEEKHTINDKEVSIYVHPEKKHNLYLECKGEEVESCYHLFRDDMGRYKCKIHPIRSLTCRMPHIRINNACGKSASIGIIQYGRNCLLGCPVVLADPKDAEEFEATKQSRIDSLTYLQQIAEDMNCDTYLPQIIDYVKLTSFDNYERFVGLDLLPQFSSKKLFTI